MQLAIMYVLWAVCGGDWFMVHGLLVHNKQNIPKHCKTFPKCSGHIARLSIGHQTGLVAGSGSGASNTHH